MKSAGMLGHLSVSPCSHMLTWDNDSTYTVSLLGELNKSIYVKYYRDI